MSCIFYVTVIDWLDHDNFLTFGQNAIIISKFIRKLFLIDEQVHFFNINRPEIGRINVRVFPRQMVKKRLYY